MNIVRTTANIDKSIDMRICEAANLCGITPQQIADILLRIMIKKKPFEFRLYRTVEYQERRDKDRWECFHLELPGNVYEGSIDLRKLMKLSVSYLLSYAVVVYLERVVKMIMGGEGSDNYPENNSIPNRHTPKISTFPILHAVSAPSDYPDYLRSSA